MRPLSVLTPLLAAACAANPPAADGPVPHERPFRISGYDAYWTGEAWRDYPFDVLDRLYLFELEVGADGNLLDPHGWPGAWEPLRTEARARRIAVEPTISMHDPDAFEVLFSDPARVAGLTDALASILRGDPDLAGLHLDFETFRPVPLPARDGFTAFVAALRERTNALGRPVSLSLFVLGFDDGDAFNERALAPLVDALVVQGYDLHDRNGERAGPVAPLRGWDGRSWEGLLARFDSLGLPRSKLVMGVPLFGYEWPTETDRAGAATRGAGVVLALSPRAAPAPGLAGARDRAERHGPRRDDISGSPWYAYQGPDGWYQGWYEDAASLGAKYEFVRRHGLRGVALFPLGYGGPEEWEELRRLLESWRSDSNR